MLSLPIFEFKFLLNIDNITTDTLDECDREYDRLDDLYRVRQPILDSFEQWKVLAQQYSEFQVRLDLIKTFY